MTISTIAAFITEISVLLGVVIGVISFGKKIAEGVKCLLRSKMLEIYYRNKDTETIRQYEKENFLLLYAAYKALKGNSFIDDIKEEIRKWKVVS
jgi:hypothetical protein